MRLRGVMRPFVMRLRPWLLQFIKSLFIRIIPLGQLADRTGELDPTKLVVVHCKGGYRSSIASSILRRGGLHEIADLTGGFDAWKAADLKPQPTP